MNATRWILGCALTAAIASPAVASPRPGGADTQDIGSQHATGAASPARSLNSGGSGGGGDVVDLRQDTSDAPASSSSETGADGNAAPVSTGARQATSHHSGIGWQSLLPGSIQ